MNRNATADVLIIGAGITGAMVADALTAADLKVALVDSRGPAKGSTTASTALVQHEIDTPLIQLARSIGKADAARAWRRSRLAVDGITARLAELEVADVQRRDTLYLAGKRLDAEGLLKEHHARRAAGLASTYLDRKALHARFGLRRSAALVSYGGLTINPQRATFALLEAALSRKAALYSPVEIVDMDARRSGVTATARNGHRIHAAHLVFATGYELPQHVPHRGHRVISTWAIATVRQPRRLWPEMCMIWEASEPYLYVRATSDGRIVCGGEDEDFSDEGRRDALIERKTRTLQKKLKRLLPGVDTSVDFAWAGSFGSSDNGLPRIGPVPRQPNCWVALGYGGNGTTYARIAADVISGALTGHPDLDADLYGF